MRFLSILSLAFIISSAASAKSHNLNEEMQTFSVQSAVTRVIYTPGSAVASISIINPQSYPMLVQSEVFKADKKEKAPFIVTPPLFRLDGNQRAKIKIVSIGDDGPSDREMLYWLCMTGIPPKPDSPWAQGNPNIQVKQATLLTQLRVKSCIKLLVRPNSLKVAPVDVATSMSWHKVGSKITVDNPTPYYMNLKAVRFGSTTIATPPYVPPKGQLVMTINGGDSGPVYWTIITDFGGISHEFESQLK